MCRRSLREQTPDALAPPLRSRQRATGTKVAIPKPVFLPSLRREHTAAAADAAAAPPQQGWPRGPSAEGGAPGGDRPSWAAGEGGGAGQQQFAAPASARVLSAYEFPSLGAAAPTTRPAPLPKGHAFWDEDERSAGSSLVGPGPGRRDQRDARGGDARGGGGGFGGDARRYNAEAAAHRRAAAPYRDSDDDDDSRGAPVFGRGDATALLAPPRAAPRPPPVALLQRRDPERLAFDAELARITASMERERGGGPPPRPEERAPAPEPEELEPVLAPARPPGLALPRGFTGASKLVGALHDEADADVAEEIVFNPPRPRPGRAAASPASGHAAPAGFEWSAPLAEELASLQLSRGATPAPEPADDGGFGSLEDLLTSLPADLSLEVGGALGPDARDAPLPRPPHAAFPGMFPMPAPHEVWQPALRGTGGAGAGAGAPASWGAAAPPLATPAPPGPALWDGPGAYGHYAGHRGI
jgi:hypothetical protein